MTVETRISDRDKMLQRVLNLRSRADDSASSEAEMNAALSMAARLMDSYNIEEAELAIAEAEGRIVLEIIHKVADTSLFKDGSTSHRHIVLNALTSIGDFTETKVVVGNTTGAITFTGHRPDVELANYLVAVIKGALDREYYSYRNSVPATGYGAKTSFQVAMVARINKRLSQMTAARISTRADAKQEAQKRQIGDNCTALVISAIAEQKSREVNRAFQIAYSKLGKSKVNFRATNATAHGAGRAAGDKVHLGRAVEGSNTKRLRA